MGPPTLPDGRILWSVGPVRLTIDDLVAIGVLLRLRGGMPTAKARVSGRVVRVGTPEGLAAYIGAPGVSGFGLASADAAVSVVLDRRHAWVIGPPGDPVTHAVVHLLGARFSPFASLLNTAVLVAAILSAGVTFLLHVVSGALTAGEPRTTWGAVASVALAAVTLTAAGQGGAHVRRR